MPNSQTNSQANIQPSTQPNSLPTLRKHNCTKKQHESQEDARMFQMRITNNKPFWVYLCPICNKWHVSFHGLPNNLLNHFAHMVRNSHPDVTHVESKSNYKKIFDIKYQDDIFRVVYDHHSKKVTVIG